MYSKYTNILYVYLCTEILEIDIKHNILFLNHLRVNLDVIPLYPLTKNKDIMTEPQSIFKNQEV